MLHKTREHILRIVATIICSIHFSLGFSSEILIVTSYNPDTQKTLSTLSDITDEIKKTCGSSVSVSIESMNCKNLSEAYLWRDRMKEIIDAHKEHMPKLIILLGQEAWTSYLSQKTKIAKETPCMAALVSTNTVILPEGNCNFHTWSPQSVEYTNIKDFNIAGGVFYKYDMEKNYSIIKKLYPKTKNIALITDFTYGGLAMQAHVMSYMKKHKDINLQLLDGRTKTIFEMQEKLKHLTAQNTILWIGTWRIDCTENFVLANTTEVLHSANPNIPAFSLASVGMGNWAIGGYVPEYGPQGKKIADIAARFIKTKKKTFITIHNEYSFDKRELDKFNINTDELPDNAVVINTQADFLAKHKIVVSVVLGILLVLVFGLIFALYYISKIKKLTLHLEKQSKELEEAKDLAVEANKIKTSFIANMSHEIRTPLNAIVGFTDLMAQDDCDENDKKAFSLIIKENSDMLLDLINQVLDISRIEAGKITISKKMYNVVEICHTAVVSVQHAKNLRGVELIEEYPNEEVLAKTDTIRLKEVIINLLTNACKFTEKGFIKLSIEVDKDNRVITFCVKDTGTGIPEDKAEYIFERFAKLNQFAQGTGLGLPLSRIIVENLGGKIWLDTSYHDGACFKFTHPIE